MGDQRWLVDDVAGPAALAGQLGQGPVAGPAPGALGRPLDLAPQGPVGQLGPHAVDVEAVEGPRQQRLAGQGAQLPPVGVGAAQDRVLAGVLGQAVLAAGHPHAGGQPVQVPLPGPGVGLVEVVEVEDQVALGRGVEAEVAQVGVAADDRLDPGAGKVGEVLGHQGGRAAQERVRRGHHPPDPHRHQPLQPPLVGLVDQVQRVGPVLGRPPAPQGAPPHPVAQGPPGLEALLAGRQRGPQDAGHVTLPPGHGPPAAILPGDDGPASRGAQRADRHRTSEPRPGGPRAPAGGLGQAGRGARLLLAGHHRPDRLPELRLADRPGRGGGRDRADRPGHQHPDRAGLQPGAAGQGDGQHRPALGRPPDPRPRGGWPPRRLPGGRPVLRRPGPAARRRPGAAAPGVGGPAGGRQPVPGGPADHPGPHPAADRRAVAAGRAAGGPLGRRLHPRGRPAGDGRRRHQ